MSIECVAVELKKIFSKRNSCSANWFQFERSMCRSSPAATLEQLIDAAIA